MTVRKEKPSIWGDFPSPALARKLGIDGDSPIWKGVQILLIVSFSVVVYFAASQFVWKSVEVVGRSMEPTLQDGEFRILNRMVYSYREPDRGEVVVFRDPADSRLSVKRVIGVPGDHVEIRDGKVLVNAVPLAEGYLGDDAYTHALGAQFIDLTIEDGNYFLLGDNRNNSTDSRYYGAVSRSAILGMVWN